MTLRVRALLPDGDYNFGRGRSAWLVDSPEAVAQCAKTRLQLWTGEWFLDTAEGTPYPGKILGTGTAQTYDQAIRERILGTPGVTEFDEYASALANRQLIVSARINTQFGDDAVPVTAEF